MNWWIDLPKLTKLTTEVKYSSVTFHYPRIITLEGISYHSILTNRHALSHHCHSWRGMCFQLWEIRSDQEFLYFFSLISRHHSRTRTLSPFHCFFHIRLQLVSIPIITSIPLFHSKQYTHNSLYFTTTHHCSSLKSFVTIVFIQLIYLQYHEQTLNNKASNNITHSSLPHKWIAIPPTLSLLIPFSIT